MDTKYMVQTHKLDLVHRHQFRRFIELGENVLGQPPAEERNLREERCTNPGQGPNESVAFEREVWTIQVWVVWGFPDRQAGFQWSAVWTGKQSYSETECM